MLKKINKLLLVIIVVEVILIIGFFIKPYIVSTKAQAAHDVGTPSELYVTITAIELVNKTGIAQSIFSGSKEVDLAKVSTFEVAGLMDVTIPPGDYTGYKVKLSKTMRAKGTAIVSGTPYYTKEAHKGYTSGPAELETIDTGLDQYSEGNFVNTISLSGTITIRLVVDINNVLCYWNGSDTQPKPEMTAGTMTIVPLPLAIVFGRPGSKEVYEVVDSTNATSKGRLALMFDSSGNYVGGMGRALLNNSNTSSIFFTGGFPISIYSLNQDGTINMGAESKNEGQKIAWYMPKFSRTVLGGTSSGSWNIIYNRASGASSGTYTATRTE